MDKRRKYERVTAIIPAELISLEDTSRWEVNVTMLGRGGLELFSPQSVEEGAGVAVQLHLYAGREGDGVEEVQGTVVWLKIDIDGNAIGVKFTEPLTPQHHPLLTQYLERIKTGGKPL